uniref:Uncharacterized protein n=1 Tax=Streptomyces zinciresistens K42 TaxID=700597 RepID=G2GNK2_9ACTN|nr:hypothetical protein SZN_35537 [Streptomyces zinciresistens K42]
MSKRYGFDDVLLISEVVATSSARKDYDDCTAEYGRHGIPTSWSWTLAPGKPPCTPNPP